MDPYETRIKNDGGQERVFSWYIIYIYMLYIYERCPAKALTRLRWSKRRSRRPWKRTLNSRGIWEWCQTLEAILERTATMKARSVHRQHSLPRLRLPRLVARQGVRAIDSSVECRLDNVRWAASQLGHGQSAIKIKIVYRYQKGLAVSIRTSTTLLCPSINLK